MTSRHFANLNKTRKGTKNLLTYIKLFIIWRDVLEMLICPLLFQGNEYAKTAQLRWRLFVMGTDLLQLASLNNTHNLRLWRRMWFIKAAIRDMIAASLLFHTGEAYSSNTSANTFNIYDHKSPNA